MQGMLFAKKSKEIPSKEDALPGREQSMPVRGVHAVNGNPTVAPFGTAGQPLEQIVVGMGCFWGAERKFWQADGVYATAVGYVAGPTPNPSYEEVCSGRTGHNEVVLVVFDPAIASLDKMLAVFWESHDPTQGMRQGNDAGTQYRSGIYTTSDAQQQAAEASRDVFQHVLNQASPVAITTEILPLEDFYYAEDYHQQYLAKNPNGYCGIGGTGLSYPLS
ncbi:MAG: peptide-methionine (S)-S-oxide reductase [Myxococcota bacterium]|jgi:peptide-methionine (S)-S-oxide reductase